MEEEKIYKIKIASMKKLKMIVKVKSSWYLMHISSFIHSVIFVFRNEEKLVAILV